MQGGYCVDFDERCSDQYKNERIDHRHVPNRVTRRDAEQIRKCERDDPESHDNGLHEIRIRQYDGRR
jgi:hypothetical protein